MRRPLAQLLLALMIIGLLYSMYAFSRGDFIAAMIIYPPLIAIYLLFQRYNRKDN